MPEENIETKTYELKLSNGKRKSITIPANWKVTYGPLVPNRIGNTGGYTSPGVRKVNVALRIYEKKDQQRAIFTDVIEFVDTSIIITDLPSERYDTPNERAARNGVRRDPIGLHRENEMDINYSRQGIEIPPSYTYTIEGTPDSPER